MLQFAQPRKPRGLFGMPGHMTPGGGFGGGVVPDDTVRETAPMGGAAPKKKKSGLFGSNGVAWKVLGALGDAFSDGPPIFTQGLLERRSLKDRMEAEEQQYQRRRMDGRDDWLWKQQNDPPEDDVFTRTLRAAGIDPNSPQGRALYSQRATSMANPVQWVTGADGIPRPMPRAMDSGPQVLGPDLDSDWELEGGGGGNATGGFRR